MKLMIELRYEPKMLANLMKIWPNAKKEKGVTAYSIAKQTGLSQQSVLNLSNEDSENANPSWKALKLIEGFFEGLVKFSIDSSNSIDNDANLKKLEAFLDKNVYETPLCNHHP